MATVVCFHAHPDDEAIATGGTMARLADEGHRVVLVSATRGEHGEVADGVLRPGETLAERRTEELSAACRILGVAHVAFLGYHDSGMMGTPQNHLPEAFWQADLDEAAGRLADVLRAERADVLTIYDANGSYGHPDHIQVHRVGLRAARLARIPGLFEAVVNRERVRELFARMQAMVESAAAAAEVDQPDLDLDTFGVPEADITHALDVRAFAERKRAAILAHGSQVGETSIFARMPAEMFREAMGMEWFVEVGAPKVASGAWRTTLLGV